MAAMTPPLLKGVIAEAWLLRAETARNLLTSGKTPYIPVTKVRDQASIGNGIINITKLLNLTAKAQFV